MSSGAVILAPVNDLLGFVGWACAFGPDAPVVLAASPGEDEPVAGHPVAFVVVESVKDGRLCFCRLSDFVQELAGHGKGFSEWVEVELTEGAVFEEAAVAFDFVGWADASPQLPVPADVPGSEVGAVAVEGFVAGLDSGFVSVDPSEFFQFFRHG